MTTIEQDQLEHDLNSLVAYGGGPMSAMPLNRELVRKALADSRALAQRDATLAALREKLGMLLQCVATGERIRVSVAPRLGSCNTAWFEYPLSPADAAECLKLLEGK